MVFPRDLSPLKPDQIGSNFAICQRLYDQFVDPIRRAHAQTTLSMKRNNIPKTEINSLTHLINPPLDRLQYVLTNIKKKEKHTEHKLIIAHLYCDPRVTPIFS